MNQTGQNEYRLFQKEVFEVIMKRLLHLLINPKIHK